MDINVTITDYYELLALYRALIVARFSREGDPRLIGSPYLAELSRRVVEALKELEVQRGNPERATVWDIRIDTQGEIWSIAVGNAANNGTTWETLTPTQKREMVQILISPFMLTDSEVELFILEVQRKIEQT